MGYNPYLGQPVPGVPGQPAAAIPGPEPGMIFIPGMGMQQITDWKETIIYDAEQLPINIATGQTFTFFRNLAIAGVPKGRLWQNIITPSQLPAGQRAIVYGVHFMCQPGTPADDVQAIMGGGYAEFRTGVTKVEKEGPLWSFPSPFGLTGYLSQDGLAVPSEKSNINNGVPAPASIGSLKIPIDITNELTFQAILVFDNAVVLTAVQMVYCVLRCFLQTPVR